MVRTKTKCNTSLKNKIIISAFGMLMIFLGFFIEELIIKVGLQNITAQVIAVVTLLAVYIEYLNLGVKPNKIVKQFKRFDSKEKVTFTITTLVGVYAIANLFGWQGFLSFTSGQLIVIGAFTVLDVWTNFR